MGKLFDPDKGANESGFWGNVGSQISDAGKWYGDFKQRTEEKARAYQPNVMGLNRETLPASMFEETPDDLYTEQSRKEYLNRPATDEQLQTLGYGKGQVYGESSINQETGRWQSGPDAPKNLMDLMGSAKDMWQGSGLQKGYQQASDVLQQGQDWGAKAQSFVEKTVPDYAKFAAGTGALRIGQANQQMQDWGDQNQENIDDGLSDWRAKALNFYNQPQSTASAQEEGMMDYGYGEYEGNQAGGGGPADYGDANQYNQRSLGSKFRRGVVQPIQNIFRNNIFPDSNVPIDEGPYDPSDTRMAEQIRAGGNWGIGGN